MQIVWKPGLLLRINDYKFEDDGSTRDKYAIVLWINNDEAYLIHSLTTSQNKSGFPAEHLGCQVYRSVPYFFIPQGQVIGDQGYSFDKDTFIFFNNNVRKASLQKFKDAAKSIFKLAPLGCLTSEELKRLLKCILKSRQIEISVFDELNALKDSL